MILTGLLHLFTGVAYILGVGGLSALAVWRQARAGKGINWFGMGLVGMASSCGPHHLHLAEHLLLNPERFTYSWLDFATILVALPFGLAWLYLRSEVEWGGRGDRFLSNRFVGKGIALGFAAYVTTLFGAMVSAMFSGDITNWSFWPQYVLIFLYCLVAWFLWVGMSSNHREGQAWSVGGLALMCIFPTCAMSHMAFGWQVALGNYPGDGHFLWIDVWGILAAAFFCSVTLKLKREQTVKSLEVENVLRAVTEHRAAVSRATTVLIADDEVDIRELLRVRLNFDYVVVGETGNGKEAITMAEKLQPDVIILDLLMPELGGIEAIPRLRVVSPNSKIVLYAGLSDVSVNDPNVSLVAKGGSLSNLTQAIEKATTS